MILDTVVVTGELKVDLLPCSAGDVLPISR